MTTTRRRRQIRHMAQTIYQDLVTYRDVSPLNSLEDLAAHSIDAATAFLKVADQQLGSEEEEAPHYDMGDNDL